MQTTLFERVTRAIVACSTARETAVSPELSLVNDLAFDSMAMVRLGVALEDELDRPIMLDEWLQRCEDPADLTVQSLCDYLQGDSRDAAVVPGG